MTGSGPVVGPGSGYKPSLRIAGLATALGLIATLAGCRFLYSSAPTDWVLAEEPKGNRLSLDIAIGDSCTSLDQIGVYESPTEVNIQAFVDRQGARQGASGCNSILKTERHEIDLARPLGARDLRGCDASGNKHLLRDALKDCHSLRR